MNGNLLKDSWTQLDSTELRILLDRWMQGSWQYDDRDKNPNSICLPMAGAACRLVLKYRDDEIVAVQRGPAFDPVEWEQICDGIEKSILAGPTKIGIVSLGVV